MLIEHLHQMCRVLVHRAFEKYALVLYLFPNVGLSEQTSCESEALFCYCVGPLKGYFDFFGSAQCLVVC